MPQLDALPPPLARDLVDHLVSQLTAAAARTISDASKRLPKAQASAAARRPGGVPLVRILSWLEQALQVHACHVHVCMWLEQALQVHPRTHACMHMHCAFLPTYVLAD